MEKNYTKFINYKSSNSHRMEFLWWSIYYSNKYRHILMGYSVIIQNHCCFLVIYINLYRLYNVLKILSSFYRIISIFRLHFLLLSKIMFLLIYNNIKQLFPNYINKNWWDINKIILIKIKYI